MPPKSFLNSILRLLLLFIGFNILGAFVTQLLLKSLFNVDVLTVLGNLNNANVDSSTINAIKFIQFIQVFFSFVIPAHLFAKQQSGNEVLEYLKLKPTPYKHFAIGVIFIFAISPLVSFTSYLNELITFPSSLSGVEEFFRNQQTQAERFSVLFLKDNTGKDLIINLFVVGFLAAISEELFFRGALQKILIDRFKNIHLAIFACAILFSALHQEFYALIPRVLLGMLLGYAYVYANSLWVPISIHFVNNATAVLLDSLFKQGYTTFNPNNNEYFGLTGLIISLIATITLFWYWQKNKSNQIAIIYGERLD
jgi:membrane protease YdiL (CAAX protease family)